MARLLSVIASGKAADFSKRTAVGNRSGFGRKSQTFCARRKSDIVGIAEYFRAGRIFFLFVEYISDCNGKAQVFASNSVQAKNTFRLTAAQAVAYPGRK
jgi:hypothetical protein